MIQHVYERARQARLVDAVIVATDDQRILAAVEACGGQAVLTSPTHPTGTDRIAEVAAQLTCDIVVNVQGDEPGIAPQAIDALVQPLCDDPSIPMSTLARPLRDVAELLTPNVNKVVVDRTGYALYFSRSRIPYPREQGGVCYRHAGIYGYRVEFLKRYAALAASPLEKAEALEQLRVLWHGYRIAVAVSEAEIPPGVDTPQDLEAVRRMLS